ncbi:hypothetical protein HKO46_07020 [Streptococcus equi subsp. zooepidemicus]|uniref:hypothetical protein n=1 Tax=Streptococcus equi TaxID=1336 RepID=UPI0002DC3E70|nr:hypothetical protein [Streptococcus equi]MBR7684885.1 hypothetical protein [Streptococcus equi subsp. zooepidemicus]MCD3442770.1 hypothetical protein [Streptococcus equi subsp. zooepidemicus]NMW55553.1 hypothetical protein [Streptococcus equi subsp. zooepidemicus]NPU62839.1 hypothetical protein [Streptococcus equi subsp. zooepidemicus]QGM13559.1 hypothetical protein GJS32_03445 [Streptococcus equi subsp. zooepidemicus]
MKDNKLGVTFEDANVDSINSGNISEKFSTNSTSVCFLMGATAGGGISASVTFIINLIF